MSSAPVSAAADQPARLVLDWTREDASRFFSGWRAERAGLEQELVAAGVSPSKLGLPPAGAALPAGAEVQSGGSAPPPLQDSAAAAAVSLSPPLPCPPASASREEVEEVSLDVSNLHLNCFILLYRRGWIPGWSRPRIRRLTDHFFTKPTHCSSNKLASLLTSLGEWIRS